MTLFIEATMRDSGGVKVNGSWVSLFKERATKFEESRGGRVRESFAVQKNCSGYVAMKEEVHVVRS